MGPYGLDSLNVVTTDLVLGPRILVMTNDVVKGGDMTASDDPPNVVGA